MSDDKNDIYYELKDVNIKEIKVGSRYRKDYDINDEFLESIKEKGILQPITLNQNMELQAGGRRYAAAAMLQIKTIPALIRQTSDELDLREVELIENVHRKEMSWHERAELTKKIHHLQKEKDPNWNLEKTAKYLDRSVGGVHSSIELADAIEVMPELKNVKKEKDVKKLLNKLDKDQQIKILREEQKKRIQDLGVSKIDLGDTNFKIQDAFEGLEEYVELRNQLGSEPNISLFIVDPPYGIDLNQTKRTVSAKTEKDHLGKYEEVEREKYPEFLDNLTQLLFKAAAENAWVIFWYGPTWHCEVISSLRRAGFSVDDIPAIWVKGDSSSPEGVGQTNAPEIYLGRAYEPFLIARKGKPIINKQGRSNVFNFKPVKPSDKYHPTQKPIELSLEILDVFSYPNTIACIPFLGSGVDLKACLMRDIKAWGYELNEHNKEHFLLSLEEIK